MPLFLHEPSGEIVRAVPDTGRKHSEARRMTADPDWREITEDELQAIRDAHEAAVQAAREAAAQAVELDHGYPPDDEPAAPAPKRKAPASSPADAA